MGADRATDLAAAQASVTNLTPLVAGLAPGTREYLTMSRLLTQTTRRVQDLSTATCARWPCNCPSWTKP